MKIAWFTPFGRRSAIAECSKIVVDELARHCEVELWVHEESDIVESDKKVVIYNSRSLGLSELQKYDHCIYNMGNYLPFHAEIYEAMKRRAGVVILHDFIMHHFFMEYYLRQRQGTDEYVSEMERYYGINGRDVATQSISGTATPIWLTDDVTRYPLFEHIVEHAKGVFVHSHFHRDQVEKKFIGEVGMAYLPYETCPVVRHKSTLFREFAIPPTKVVAISTGIVHPVKRIERVLEALGSNLDLAEKLMYVVIGDGENEYRLKLQLLAAQLGIANSVRFLGYQPSDTLRDFLHAADFAINLRFPNSEGCSLSLVEQMSYGNPAVVINSGMYGEMPDVAVMKLSAANAEDELARALDELVFKEAVRLQMGGQAEQFARAHFTAEKYADQLLDYLSRDALSYQPIRASLHEVATELSAAGYSVERGEPALERILQEFHCVLSGRRERAPKNSTLKTLGVWLGFEHPTALHREGMTRFLHYLIKHLIELHDIECEVWCYSINEASVCASFKALFDDSQCAGRIRIVHERNYATIFSSSLSMYEHPPEISVEKNNLYELANSISRADCFLLGICYLDNALALTKPVFVPLHDLVVFEHYQNFVGENEGFRPYAKKIREAVEMFNRRKAFFFCNSEYVRTKQLMKYIAHVDDDRTAVIFLPANIPPDIHRRIPPEAEALQRYGIVKPYFFYPTQIRHHKNLIVLLRAFKLLVDEKEDAQLVLTGSLEHVPALAHYFEASDLAKHVVFARDIDEEMLYALHAYAAATVVPTLFEGGFPWQGLEAMLMDTPAILSHIDAVSERLSICKVDPSGLRLFEPSDVLTLAAHMREALSDRDTIVREQRPVKESLFQYGWADVASAYFQTISNRL